MKTLLKVLVYPKSLKDKDEAKKYTGSIKNNIKKYPKEITVDKLAELMTNGYVVCLGYADGEGSLKSGDWKYQQAYAIDIDNKGEGYLSIDKAISLAEPGLEPAFIYKTFSHTEECNKYRMVFVLDEPVNKIEDHQHILNILFEHFSDNGIIVADTSCTDTGRLFYPGSELVYAGYEVILSKADLLKRKVSKIQEKDHQNLDTKGFKDYELDTPILTLIKSSLNGYSFDGEIPYVASVPEIFDEFCCKIEIHKLLDVKLGEKFNCLFHDDQNASANIIYKDDRYKYHCFGCGVTYDIFSLIMMTEKCSYAQARKIIANAFGITIDTPWLIKKKGELAAGREYIMSGKAAHSYPELIKRMKRSNLLPVYTGLLDIAESYIIDKEISGLDEAFFYMTEQQIFSMLNNLGFNVAKSSFHTKMIRLARLGLIKILDDKEIPRNIYHILKSKQKRQDSAYHIKCYEIMPFNPVLFKRAEDMIIEDKKSSFRVSHLSREQIIRCDGRDKADAIYTQQKNFGQDKDTETFYKRYVKAARTLIEKKGWTVEDEILNRLKGFSKKTKTKYSYRCLPQLLEEEKLERVSFTKAIEKEYNVMQSRGYKLCYGSSKIIIPKRVDKKLEKE